MQAFKVILIVIVVALTNAKVYQRCELARELRYTYKLPENQISTWVCIAALESDYNTAAKSPDGHDFGIFQIDNMYWCSPPGTGCNVPCSKMVDDDISDDVKCAQTVYQVTEQERGNGFLAWTVYPRCKDNVNRYTDGCF